MLADLRRQLPPGCISDLQLDEWRTGELSAEQTRELGLHLESCCSCRARADQLGEDAQAFLLHYGERLPKRACRSKGRAWWVGSGVAALAAAILLAPFLSQRLRDSRLGVSGDDGNRTKGACRIGYFVRRGERVFQGSRDQVVQPGDRLRFTLSANEPGYVAILSRDGRGKVTEYYPGDGGGRVHGVLRNEAVDSSVELDNSLGKEVLWGVFCAQPFRTLQLMTALERDWALSPPKGCILDRLELEKTAAP